METPPCVPELDNHTHCESGAEPALHSHRVHYPDGAPPPGQSAGLHPWHQGVQRVMVVEGRLQLLGSLREGSSGEVETELEGRGRWGAG